MTTDHAELAATVAPPPSAPSIAVGPDLLRSVLGMLTQAAGDAGGVPVEFVREQAVAHNQARQFLERLILELRAENAALRSELAAARK